jgi:hypothetical protein
MSDPTSLDASVNWLAYDHRTLYDMINKGVDVASAGTVADGWRSLGSQLHDIKEQLRTAIEASADGWSGDSAQAARDGMRLIVDWADESSEHAQRVSDCIHTQISNVTTARAKMPPPQNVTPIAPPTAPVAAPAPAPRISPLVGERADVVRPVPARPVNPLVGYSAVGTNVVAQQASADAAHQLAAQVMSDFQKGAEAVDNTLPEFSPPANPTNVVTGEIGKVDQVKHHAVGSDGGQGGGHGPGQGHGDGHDDGTRASSVTTDVDQGGPGRSGHGNAFGQDGYGQGPGYRGQGSEKLTAFGPFSGSLGLGGDDEEERSGGRGRISLPGAGGGPGGGSTVPGGPGGGSFSVVGGPGGGGGGGGYGGGPGSPNYGGPGGPGGAGGGPNYGPNYGGAGTSASGAAGAPGVASPGAAGAAGAMPPMAGGMGAGMGVPGGERARTVPLEEDDDEVFRMPGPVAPPVIGQGKNFDGR